MGEALFSLAAAFLALPSSSDEEEDEDEPEDDEEEEDEELSLSLLPLLLLLSWPLFPPAFCFAPAFSFFSGGASFPRLALTSTRTSLPLTAAFPRPSGRLSPEGDRAGSRRALAPDWRPRCAAASSSPSLLPRVTLLSSEPLSLALRALASPSRPFCWPLVRAGAGEDLPLLLLCPRGGEESLSLPLGLPEARSREESLSFRGSRSPLLSRLPRSLCGGGEREEDESCLAFLSCLFPSFSRSASRLLTGRGGGEGDEEESCLFF